MEREDLEGRLSIAQSKNIELERTLEETVAQAVANKEDKDAALKDLGGVVCKMRVPGAC